MVWNTWLHQTEIGSFRFYLFLVATSYQRFNIQRILKSDWSRTFPPLTWEPKFSCICNFCRFQHHNYSYLHPFQQNIMINFRWSWLGWDPSKIHVRFSVKFVFLLAFLNLVFQASKLHWLVITLLLSIKHNPI